MNNRMSLLRSIVRHRATLARSVQLITILLWQKHDIVYLEYAQKPVVTLMVDGLGSLLVYIPTRS